mmetsp:Transcript_92994/g.289411  ORF Transcript_92994/g.289411 Transcript_92994/m.289411 type:complete len:101 (+) Transcript_92994:78-380(+)
MQVDLATGALRAADSQAAVTLDTAGTVSAVAFWHSPDFGESINIGGDDGSTGTWGAVPAHATLSFLTAPRALDAGAIMSLSVRFTEGELQIVECSCESSR